jgi:hypothetical protein
LLPALVLSLTPAASASPGRHSAAFTIIENTRAEPAAPQGTVS